MDFNATSLEGFLLVFLILFVAILVRYFVAAGAFFQYYYRSNRTQFVNRRLSKRSATARQIRSEIVSSVISSAIFAFFGALTYMLWQLDLTAVYLETDLYGYWYLPLSLVLIFFLHETYYYWIHRWMHRPKVFRIVHKVHHDSRVPTPWTAFSFHPLESLLEAVILPILLILIPVQIWVLGFYLVIMTISSVINHLDIEVYPAWFQDSWLGKQFIGATHHHYHHKDYLSNYGLYLTFWDRFMATESRQMPK